MTTLIGLLESLKTFFEWLFTLAAKNLLAVIFAVIATGMGIYSQDISEVHRVEMKEVKERQDSIYTRYVREVDKNLAMQHQMNTDCQTLIKEANDKREEQSQKLIDDLQEKYGKLLEKLTENKE